MHPYLRAIRRPLGVVILFSAVINILVMASPLYMLQLYDRVLASRSVETLISLTAITAVLLLSMAVLDVLRGRLLIRAGALFHERIANRLFDTVLARTASHPQEPAREAQKDLHDIRQFVSGTGLVALIDAPWVLVFLGVIFVMHPLLGSVALIGALILFALAFLAELSTHNILQTSRSATMKAERTLGESIRDVDALRVMGMVPNLRSLWRTRQNDAVFKQDIIGARLNALTATTKAMRLILQMAMLGTGAWLAIGQHITPGFMIAASIIMARALAPVEQALSAWRGLVAARRGYQRLDHLFSVVPEEETGMPLPPPQGALTAKNLFGGAPGNDKPIVRAINLRLEPGTVCAVVGPSAAGKSTLARLLIGAWPVLTGEVRLDGIDVASLQKHAMGRHVGYLPQDIELLEGTIRENISRFADGPPEDTVRAAKLAGIHSMILSFPDGYDTQIGTKGIVLSGGQKQRIAMARAFYGNPLLIVMDEPDAHLDEEGVAALFRALSELKAGGRIVVITTHRPALMKAIDTLVILRDGVIERFGPTPDVLAQVRQSSRTAVPAPEAPSGTTDMNPAQEAPQ